jgi:hypothetical protein
VNRRRIGVGAAAALAVLVAAVVVTVLVTRGGDDSPGGRFELAAKTFHRQYDTFAPRVADGLAKAGGGFGDAGFTAAQQDARKVADAFGAYDKAVGAVAFPAGAQAPASDLRKVVQAGRLVWSNAAGFFEKAQMQDALAQYRPQVESAVAAREEAVRGALRP